MEKPASEVLEFIESQIILQRNLLRDAEALKEELPVLISRLSHESDKVEVARYLYWKFPEINTGDLAEAITGLRSVKRLEEAIGPMATDEIRCIKCQKPITFKKRKVLFQALKGSEEFTCSECREISRRKITPVYRSPVRKQEEDSRLVRLKELKNMPYSEYLQTPEWQETRKQALKDANYQCALCPATNRVLHVHHRTYERLGEERPEDLTVLCDKCHEKFHTKEESVESVPKYTKKDYLR